MAHPMTTETPELVAAVDLGSNSFHMLVARVVEGQVEIVDRIKEMVRLGGGLDEENRLDEATAERAIACLERFGQRLRDIPPRNVRAVGTMTLRRMRNSQAFVSRAEAALGHSIDVIAGREEARMIYIGVAHTHADTDERRLVVDIGGGSTELIVGERFQATHMESLSMGCVSMTRAHFADGMISKERMRQALLDGRLRVRSYEVMFRQLGWKHAIGSSGTAKALARISEANGWSNAGITADALARMRKAFVKAGHIDAIQLDGLSEDRKPVIVGGAVVMSAIFQALGIEHMSISDGALREGLMYDMLGRREHDDVRRITIDRMQQRYAVDTAHAARVETTLMRAFEQLQPAWQLNPDRDHKLLSWAVQLHEVGMSIAHSGFHRHGAYILENSDMPGFSRLEQQLLAAIVLGHRKKLRQRHFDGLPAEKQQKALHLCLLLRLGALLHRSRAASRRLPDIRYSAGKDALRLDFPDNWLDSHPLTRADLGQEARYLGNVGISLEFADSAAERP